MKRRRCRVLTPREAAIVVAWCDANKRLREIYAVTQRDLWRDGEALRVEWLGIRAACVAAQAEGRKRG